MKLLRIAGLIVFLLSAAVFTGYEGYKSRYKDLKGPVISFQTESIQASVNTPEAELLQDVKAYDDKDGDVTKSVIIEEISKFISPGKRIITYAAFDKTNNITKKERLLIYTDYIPPRFALSQPLSFIIGEYDDIIQDLTVSDCIDGDITRKIRYTQSDDYFGESEGSYEVEFQVTNSAGDVSALSAMVDFHYPSYINQDEIPVILLNNYLVYLKAGEVFNPIDYLEGIRFGQKEYSFRNQQSFSFNGQTLSMDMIQISSDVDMNQPGSYEVEYSLSTSDGFTGRTKLLVIVEA
jgi:hypothetical protein